MLSLVIAVSAMVRPRGKQKYAKKSFVLTNVQLKDLEDDASLSFISQNDLDNIHKEKNPAERVHVIRRMTCSLHAKRILRSKFNLEDVKYRDGCAAFCYAHKLRWHKFKRYVNNFFSYLTLWRNSFKSIEGHYGSAVLSYFVFLKWLFLLNIYIFLLTFIFVTIPQILFVREGFDFTVVGETNDSISQLRILCTDLYNASLVVNNNDMLALVQHFLQGTGWMEETLLFEGYYSDKSLALGSREEYTYNMPLAYILVIISCLSLSLVLMVRHTAKGLKTSLMDADDTKLKFANIVFGGWDYSMFNLKSSVLKQKMLHLEILALLAEFRHAKEKKERKLCHKFVLYILRFILNVLVLGILGASAYLIYYVVGKSLEFTQRSDYESINNYVKLLMEYILSITITALNIVIPKLLTYLIILEDHSPDNALKITLARTVFLRLSSVAVVIGTLYSQIVCQPVDECNVGVTPDCPVIRCWETYVGQEIYKLTIFDFFTSVAVVFLLEFPRTLFVICCKCKLAQIIGKPDFDVPKNVLDLVYSQTLCWLGMFFSPLIPAISVTKFFIFFYLKKMTVLFNYVPSSRPYRASKAHFFFMIVLLLAFILCCIPLGYVVFKMQPSYGCGPFRAYDSMYDIITITIETWPEGIQDIFEFISSAGFVVPSFVLILTLVYYYHSATVASRSIIRLLKEQLVTESRDKQFLIQKIRDLSGNAETKNTPQSFSSDDDKQSLISERIGKGDRAHQIY